MTAHKQNSNQQLFNPLVNASNITSTLLNDLFETQNAFFQQGLNQFSDHSQKLMSVTDIPSAIEMTQQHVGQYQTQASQLSTAIVADLTKATQAYQSMLTTQFSPEEVTATPAPTKVAKKATSSTTTTKASPSIKTPAKPVKKTAVKTAVQTTAKAAVKSTAKPAAKDAAKDAVKTPVKAPAKVVSKPTVSAKPAEVKKQASDQKPLNTKLQPA